MSSRPPNATTTSVPSCRLASSKSWRRRRPSPRSCPPKRRRPTARSSRQGDPESHETHPAIHSGCRHRHRHRLVARPRASAGRRAGPRADERSRPQPDPGADARKGDAVARAPEDGFATHLQHEDESRRADRRGRRHPPGQDPAHDGRRRHRRHHRERRPRTPAAAAPGGREDSRRVSAVAQRARRDRPQRARHHRGVPGDLFHPADAGGDHPGRGPRRRGRTRRSIPSISGRRGPSSRSARAASAPRSP